VTASLAFRRNEAAILAGNPPEKYRRILPHITGQRVLEVGSAEGVLALLLAQQGKPVTAIEKNHDRHEAAKKLHRKWSQFGDYPAPVFVNGAIGDRLSLLLGQDTFVAVRAIYYFGDRLDEIFAAVAEHVPEVVLCGNENRARRCHAGTPDEPLGEMNFYASAEGMRALLERHGYRIVGEVTEGDPIIVGRRVIR
jgi:hypothetical protein